MLSESMGVSKPRLERLTASLRFSFVAAILTGIALLVGITLPVSLMSQSFVKSIDGDGSVTMGATPDEVNVKGTLLTTYLIVNSDTMWQKKGDLIVKSAKQLAVGFEEGAALQWGADSVNWTFYVDERSNNIKGLAQTGPTQAVSFLKFSSDPDKFFIISRAEVGDGKTETKNAAFQEVLFRKNAKGDLIFGSVTSADSQLYLPPVIISMTPCIAAAVLKGEAAAVDLDNLDKSCFEKKDRYTTSTDIVVAPQENGSLLASGKVEYLLLGWKRLYANFGEGAKIRFLGEPKTPVQLVSPDGDVTVAGPGNWVVADGKWKRVAD